MAISLSLILLLVELITTTATSSTHHHISATETQNHLSKAISSYTSPPPPPLTEIQETHLNNIIDALIGAGDFASWANLLTTADASSIPLTATFFIPGNDAVSNLSTANADGASFDSFLIPYHIVPQRLTFSDLQQLTTRTRLPTLLHAKYIVVTNNSLENFAVDGSQITQPDIFLNAAFAVHGVEKLLDYSVYGDGRVPSPPLPENITTPKAANPGSPEKRNPVFPGDIIMMSNASCLCGFLRCSCFARDSLKIGAGVLLGFAVLFN